jgi:hypothetical protein
MLYARYGRSSSVTFVEVKVKVYESTRTTKESASIHLVEQFVKALR